MTGVALETERLVIERLIRMAAEQPLTFPIYNLYRQHGFPKGYTEPYSAYLLDHAYRVTLTHEYITPDLGIRHLSVTNAGFTPIERPILAAFADAFAFVRPRYQESETIPRHKQAHAFEPLGESWRRYDRMAAEALKAHPT